ncbi:MAG: ankyrin repeat domain-containing protein [bacterium]
MVGFIDVRVRSFVALLATLSCLLMAVACDRQPGVADSVTAPAHSPATRLLRAAAGNDPVETRRLLDAGFDADQPGPGGRTALMVAAEHGRADTLALLLRAGAAIDLGDSGGMTALMLAARHGHGDAVRRLIEAGADVAIRSRTGTSALLEAVRGGDLPAVDALLVAGADPAQQCERGLGVLHVVRGRAESLLDRLLGLGLDVDQADSEGLTPVMRAARLGDVALLARLHGAGADLDRRDVLGRDALQHARLAKQRQAVDWLTARRSDPIHQSVTRP